MLFEETLPAGTETISYLCWRASTATKWIGKWVRGTVGVTDRRFDPNHSRRHRFISECREAGIDEETRNALTGHSDGSVSRDYGEFYIRTVFYPAILKLVSPLDKVPMGGAGQRDGSCPAILRRLRPNRFLRNDQDEGPISARV